MKAFLVGAFASAVFVGCDRDRGGGPREEGMVESGYEVPGRGTEAIDVRNPVGTNPPMLLDTGPGGAIPGGRRTTSPSIPGATETNNIRP